MPYLLTENNPKYGLKGLLIDREQYVALPYYDRAIFEVANDETEYDFKLSVKKDDKEFTYLLRHKLQLKEIMEEFHLDDSFAEILAQLSKKTTVSITLPNVVYTFNVLIPTT